MQEIKEQERDLNSNLKALTSGQKQFFDDNGYLVLESVFTPREVENMRAEMDQLIRHPEQFDHRMGITRYEDEGPPDPTNPNRVWRIMDLPWASDQWFRMITDSRIVDPMVDLLGPNINFHNGKAILKPAGRTETLDWHQDYPYEHHTSPDLAAAIIYLQDVRKEEGATLIAPGTHKNGEWEHEERDGLFVIPEDRIGVDPVHVEVEAGSVAFIHVLVVHRAGINKSNQTKCAVINEYKTAEAKDVWGNKLAYAELPLRRNGQKLGWL